MSELRICTEHLFRATVCTPYVPTIAAARLSAEARPTDGFERNPRREIRAARTEQACVQSTDWSAAAGFSGPWSSGVDNKKHASTRDYSLAEAVAQLGRSAGNPAPTRTGKIFVRGIDFSLSRV